MATVTKEQRTYAVSRIREAGMKKVGIYKERSCLLREERKLTDADKRELVYAGVVPLRPDLSTYDIRNCFDFSAFENTMRKNSEPSPKKRKRKSPRPSTRSCLATRRTS